ncbi:YigZ family protein [Guyparkeria hydrothermalis]|uniref:YigZ family protein n=1 Tax=Guyparkeria TaxID=2035712 RepID=UPI0010AD8CEB|nr:MULTISPECIES: YigZ family protein [Guyparkeria]MCL7750515.1 YigZ family protein [Guyparkeria hydrothermalis]TKA88942.1 YigZ family protein [Guyparkeria sp. SB14A]
MSQQPSSTGYVTPATTIERELEVKKSRFIARAGPVADRRAALAFVDSMKTDYPDARHHCWAYLVGNPDTAASAAMSDDGEPSGTAGKPILNVIQHKGIGDVIVVVTRYFGGVKLGAGGLVRAYAGATQQALADLPLDAHRPQQGFDLAFDFADEQPLRHWAEQHGAQLQSIDYGNRVTARLDVPVEQVEAFQAFLGSQGIERIKPPDD